MILSNLFRNLFLILICTISGACPLHAATLDIAGDTSGEVTSYTVKEEDTLYDIARTYDLGIVEIMAANPGVDVWTPDPGTVLTLPTAHLLPPATHKGIVINLSELRLYYFPNKRTVMTFPIGIGMEGWQTPLGKTRITLKRKHPVWVPPDSIRNENPDLPDMIPAGPENPLGDFAMNLGWTGYRIHGTNRPQGIGRRSSHGCIRLYPEDIDELFKVVKPGTPVTVIDEPFRIGWQNDTLYLEVSPTQEQADAISEEEPIPPAPVSAHKSIAEAIGDAGEVDWYAVENATREQRGIPVPIAKR